MISGLKFRIPNGAPLTAEQLDNNFQLIKDAVDDVQSQFSTITLVSIGETAPGADVRDRTLWIRSTGSFIWNTGISDWVRVEAPVAYANTGGSAGAYTVALESYIDTYDKIVGRVVVIRANHTAPSGGCTINVNGLGAKNIYRKGTTPLSASDLYSGAASAIVYDGTNFQLISQAWGGFDVSLLTPGTNNGAILRTRSGSAVWEDVYETEEVDYEAIPASGGGTVSFPHGMTKVPIAWRVSLICTDAGGDAGFSYKDELDISTLFAVSGGGSYSVAFQPYADATNLNAVRHSNSVGLLAVADGGTGNSVFITESKWKFKAYAIK